MRKLVKGTSKKAGLPPGSAVYIGEKKADGVKISVIDYDEATFQEKEVSTIQECFYFKDTPTVTWINIYNGPQNLDSVLSYTWEENEGGPSGEFKEKAHTVIKGQGCPGGDQGAEDIG
jgi:hypothetical protein